MTGERGPAGAAPAEVETGVDGETGDPSTLGRDALSGISSCGVLGSPGFLGCFPLVMLVLAVVLWLVPLKLFQHWARSPAEVLLDDLAMAEERWAGGHGDFVAAAPCPKVLPEGEPALFPGECDEPWPDLGLPWQELTCQVWVEVPAPGRFVAWARCPGELGGETWFATESGGPQIEGGAE